MAVVPLTLTISLCLAFTFIVFFLREQRRRRFVSTESESLLPLADENAHLAAHAHDGGCGGNGTHVCANCPRHQTNAGPAIAA
jgi:hypothetical protein